MDVEASASFWPTLCRIFSGLGSEMDQVTRAVVLDVCRNPTSAPVAKESQAHTLCPHVHWDIAACGIWSLGIWLPCPLDPYTSTSSSSTFSAPQKALALAIWTWFNLRVNIAAGSCRQGGPGAIAGGDRKGDGGRGRLWVMQDLITWCGKARSFARLHAKGCQRQLSGSGEF